MKSKFFESKIRSNTVVGAGSNTVVDQTQSSLQDLFARHIILSEKMLINK